MRAPASMLSGGAWWETPRVPNGRTFSGSLRELLALHGDRLAVCSTETGRNLTYRELFGQANYLLAKLTAEGIRPGDRVAIICERSPEEIVIVLACAIGGLCYCGIDIDSPSHHREEILARFRPRMLIHGDTPGHLNRDLPRSSTTRTFEYKLVARKIALGWRLDNSDVPDDLPLYVAFTSGTSGTPKGVVIRRSSVNNLAVGARTYVVAPADGHRVLRLAPLAFDASTYEIFASLVAGATICIYPPGILDVELLGKFIESDEITHLWLTASLFSALMSIRPRAVENVRHLLSGGEPVPVEAVEKFFKMCPEGTFTNGYGPTEATTFATQFTIDAGHVIGNQLALGKPLPGVAVSINSDSELLIAGAGLATGYLDDERLTDDRFQQHNGRRAYSSGDRVDVVDGMMYFSRRLDGQVKIRGHRVETEHIEFILCSAKCLETAVVVAVPVDGDTARLGCAYVPKRPDPSNLHPEGTRSVLRDILKSKVPTYAIPTIWREVERMPMTHNGKVDRLGVASLLRGNDG